jgi:hypothetical protein
MTPTPIVDFTRALIVTTIAGLSNSEMARLLYGKGSGPFNPKARETADKVPSWKTR